LGRLPKNERSTEREKASQNQPESAGVGAPEYGALRGPPRPSLQRTNKAKAALTQAAKDWARMRALETLFHHLFERQRKHLEVLKKKPATYRVHLDGAAKLYTAESALREIREAEARREREEADKVARAEERARGREEREVAKHRDQAEKQMRAEERARKKAEKEKAAAEKRRLAAERKEIKRQERAATEAQKAAAKAQKRGGSNTDNSDGQHSKRQRREG
ncbi:hypothetical protein A4X06_0g9380, partial [Tilletia controversa]